MLDFDDYLFYSDSGAYFIRPITPLINISLATGSELIVFELEKVEREWTKRDAFVLMDCDQPNCTDTKQRLGGYILWKKLRFIMDFMK
jgi:hypothetical protein